MKRNVFLNSGSSIKVVKTALHVELQDRTIKKYHLSDVAGIFAFGDIYIDQQAIISLLVNSTPVVFFDNQGVFIGRLEPAQAQKICFDQSKFSAQRQLELGKTLVSCALEQRRRFIQRRAREANKDFTEPLAKLKPILKRFDGRWPHQHPQSINEIIGLYGAGMAVYWSEFSQMCDYFDFDGGRAGHSHLNQMVDFAYSLWHHYCWNLLLANRLNLSAGILHSDNQRHPIPPLARDLSIEHKILAERMVVKLINRKQILLKDFDDTVLPQRVCEIVKSEFISILRKEITHINGKCSFEQAIQWQMEAFGKYLDSEDFVYFPMLLK